MKLLLENWRQYIKEGESEHFPWLKEIQATDDLEEIQAIVETDRFKRVGSGAFRRVYQPIGDPDHVIKVIHAPEDSKRQMNKDDFDTAKRYPLIFPKAYGHSEDFSWVVMENTPPLTDMDEMQKVLDQSFSAEQKAILENHEFRKKYRNINFADPFDLMNVIMNSFRGDREDPPGDFDIGAEVPMSAQLQKTLHPLQRGWFAGKAAMGKAYQELSKVMHEFEIDNHEIGIGNIGHDENYNFKIIDSSVFSSDPGQGVWE